MSDDWFVSIRERDANGVLTRAGARWQESNPFGVGLATVGVFLVLMCAVLLFGIAGVMKAPALGITSMALPVLMPVLLVAGIAMRKRWREVVFERGGRIATPHGLPGLRNFMQVEGNHAHIANIEAEQTPGGFGVFAISTGGDTAFLSDNLKKAEARKVAVQLTSLLAELRASGADGGTPVGPGAPRGPLTPDGLPTIE